MSTTSVFFNQSFDKKKLQTFIYWVLKTFGEKEALTIVEELKRMGFSNATKAGLSIGLHDLQTPFNKKSLISRAQTTMNKTDREFQGAELTATERSQRIVDTWHRTSEDLRKQVVDYFSMYDQLNSVYMMASSGARGNFSQVRQLIGMRGLMADPQGQIISFPIRSNLREGLTLTEYFISCSGARKGLVDTALRTADTGYLTRRLVDISHHIVVKKVTCYTSRGIALKTLQSSQKILLPLKDRLVGRVLGENILFEPSSYSQEDCKRFAQKGYKTFIRSFATDEIHFFHKDDTYVIAKKNQEISPDLAFQISQIKANVSLGFPIKKQRPTEKSRKTRTIFNFRELSYVKASHAKARHALQSQALHIPPLTKESGAHCRSEAPTARSRAALQKRSSAPLLHNVVPANSPWVLVRSPLTCAYTHEVCQLCYGWSMAQGSLVSLGEAVGVIAGQSIGEPGTQLTMRTFHTGGVFSGDLLQEIRAPHSGKIIFPQALQGLLIRTSQGRIAFLIKVSGELLLDHGEDDITGSIPIDGIANRKSAQCFNSDGVVRKRKQKTTKLLLEPSTILFVRQGQKVQNNQILAELAITSEEGNQPIKSRQTLFSEITGRIVQWKSVLCRPMGKSSKSICNWTVMPKYDENRWRFGSKKKECYSSTYSLRLKYNSQDRSQVDNNFTMKEIVLSKKHGFECVEPPKALQLGLLNVIATRVGGRESLNICTKEQGIGLCKAKLCNRSSAPTNTVHIKERIEIQDNCKSIGKNKRIQSYALHTQAKPALSDSLFSPYLNTIAEEGDLVDESYTQV